jgi:GAF domain-containing protein
MGNVPIVTDVAPIESILCTQELNRRPPRPPDYQKENRALVALAEALSESPRNILQALADTTVQTIGVGSAGVSVLTRTDDGKRFYWPAIAGEWTAYIGGGTPRDFGPCGDVLDRNTALLFNHPERRYTYLEPAKPAVEEAWLVPFYVEGKAVGTTWAISHNPAFKFDGEDQRILNSLAKFASCAFQVTSALEGQQITRQQAVTFDTTLSTITDFAYIFDRDGRFPYVNKALLDLWGLKFRPEISR